MKSFWWKSLKKRKTLKKPLFWRFEKIDAKWIDVLHCVRKKSINTKQSTAELTPVKASLKQNESIIWWKVKKHQGPKKSEV